MIGPYPVDLSIYLFIFLKFYMFISINNPWKINVS